MIEMGRATAAALKAGVVGGVILCVIGLALGGGSPGDLSLGIGIALIVFAPFAGVLVSTACLLARRDPWALAGACLAAIVLAGLAASLL
ncbi:MAG: hypothetical protein LBG62_00500 [Candidatus Methanoplasma sp.]|jgi:hypothetical protein|nr:hypothetical protein [Candidatus Methanoplasma sp.]